MFKCDILQSSGSQTMRRGTLVCRERFPGVPCSFLEFWKICKYFNYA